MSSAFSDLWAAKDPTGWATATTQVDTVVWPAIEAAVIAGTDRICVSTGTSVRMYVKLQLADKGFHSTEVCEHPTKMFVNVVSI